MIRRIAHGLLFAALLFPSTLFAQPPDTLWTKAWDYSTNYEFLRSIRALRDGGYIAGGSTFYMNQTIQVWTAKLDQNGDEIWEHIEGGDNTDGSMHIEPTSDGGFIQCGDTWSYAGDPSFDAFIRKLDANGDTEWARTFAGIGEISDDFFFHVREVPAGGFVAVGPLYPDAFVRLDASGNLLWRMPLDINGFMPKWIEPTSDGGFVCPTAVWNEEISRYVFALVKLNHNGQLIWINDETVFGQSYQGQGTCAREDQEGFLYVCGTAREPGDTTSYGFYISKRNPDGSVIWSQNIVNHNAPWDAGSIATELCFLADGNIAVCGWSQGEDYRVHMWLVKISSDGDILWRFDQPRGEFVSIDQGRDGSIVTAYYAGEFPGDDSIDLTMMKFEPEVQVALQTWTPVIPATGGWLHYGAGVSNILVDPTPLDAWIVVTGPDGARLPLNQFPVTLQPGTTWTRPRINLYIPPETPNGSYTLEANLGVAPPDVPPGGPLGNRNMGLGSFTFTKGE